MNSSNLIRNVDLDIDFSTAGALGNMLLQKLNDLRDSDPLYFSEPQNSWIVTSHALVTEGFNGTLPLSSHRHELVASFVPDPQQRQEKVGYLLELIASWVVFSDAPQHMRLRKLMVKAFSKSMIERYRPFVRNVVRQTLDKVRDRRVVDVMEDLALPVPTLAIVELLGMPHDHYDLLHRAAQLSTETIGGYPTIEQLAAANDAFLSIRDLLQAEVDKRRAAPTEDFVSTLVHAEVDGDRFTDFEIVSQLTLLVLAGHESTASTIALSLAALSENPAACAFIRDNPDRIVDASMELMRYVAMSTSMSRIVTQDFDWHGRQIKKGQFVHLMIAGANRDPAIYTNPEQLDMTRPQDRNMTFAPGLHFCIGHHLAKLEVSEYLTEFLARFESFEIANSDYTFNNSISFRAPRGMKMRLSPAR